MSLKVSDRDFGCFQAILLGAVVNSTTTRPTPGKVSATPLADYIE